jgi:outer membrane protein
MSTYELNKNGVRRIRLTLLIPVLLFACRGAYAQEELPAWEAGMGVAVLNIPDYRGSDRQRTYVLPLPYLIYRGETVKVDKEGAHADLFKSDTVKLDLSLNAGPPAKSSDDGARAGMPDIDPTLEVGPVLKVLLSANHDRSRILSLRLPVRGVVATNFRHSKAIGWVFSPNLNYDVFDFPAAGWNFGTAAGPVFASERYHDYYYEVAQQYATATRPAYDAKGGYSGAQFTMALSRRYPKFWVGAFLRYDDLHGAVFEDSPLIRKKSSLMYGAGIAWVFAKSSQMVTVQPELLK